MKNTKIMFIGPVGVGKTRIVNYIDDKQEFCKPTLGINIIDLPHIGVSIFDTSGNNQYEEMKMSFLQKMDVAVFIIDENNIDYVYTVKNIIENNKNLKSYILIAPKTIWYGFLIQQLKSLNLTFFVMDINNKYSVLETFNKLLLDSRLCCIEHNKKQSITQATTQHNNKTEESEGCCCYCCVS